jgi:hypothetical protein
MQYGGMCMQEVYSNNVYKEYLTNALFNKQAKLAALKSEKRRDGTYYTPIIQALIMIEEGIIERLAEKVLWME